MAKSPINFNIYEVLEPLKCTAPKDENVGILIDITDGIEDLSGSHLDSIKKSEFDLVDLFQNIYVTPQHVKKLKEERIANGSKESQKSHIDRTKTNILKPLEKADINELLQGCDVDVTDGPEKSNYVSNEDTFYNYDIPKVLEVPTLYDCTSNENAVRTDIDNIPESTNLRTDYHNFITEVPKDLKKKTMELDPNQTNSIASNVLPVTKSADCQDILQKVARDLIERKSTESTLPNVSRAQNNGNALTLNKLPNVDNFDTLQTAKLDKKLYAKRQTKSEREKILYTKGPDLYEKSVVLPQIMKRLAIRKKENEVKLTRRLILDSGKSSSKCSCDCSYKMALNSTNEKKESLKGNESPATRPDLFTVPIKNKAEVDSPEVKINPIVAMEDCNKERLIAHRVRSAFERFVQTGSYF